MAPIFRKFKTVGRHPFSIIALIIVGFITYNQLNAHQEALALSEMNKSDKNSVSFYDGKYHVDSAVIQSEQNKARMIASVEKQVLEQKMTKQEVPDFIWRFLDSISSDKEFDIVNPGEDWKADITNYGHVVFTKVYDAGKKDSVSIMSCDGAVLPNKQLVYFGMSNTMALMSYMHGGLGAWRNILILKLQKDKVVDFWYGSVYDGNITTKSEIISNLKTIRKGGGC